MEPAPAVVTRGSGPGSGPLSLAPVGGPCGSGPCSGPYPWPPWVASAVPAVLAPSLAPAVPTVLAPVLAPCPWPLRVATVVPAPTKIPMGSHENVNGLPTKNNVFLLIVHWVPIKIRMGSCEKSYGFV